MTFQTLTQARKHLTNKGLRDVHLRAVAKVKELKGREFELIELLQEVEEKRVFRFAGYNSLFNYCVQALELSEHQACEYIAVARKSQAYPRLKLALKNQEISVTKARRVAAVITPETQDQWLKIAKTSSKRDLEKAIAGHSPRAVHYESSRYVSSTLLQVQLIVDEETLALIKRAQDLLSQSQSASVSMSQAAKDVFSEYVERYCPVKKAERAEKKRQSKTDAETKANTGAGHPEIKITRLNGATTQPISSGPGRPEGHKPKISKAPKIAPARKSIRVYPRALLHQIMLRDQGQCTHRDPQGHRCTERRWLEIHHVTPIARGGPNELQNLRLLCRGHHRFTHSFS